MMQGDFNRFDLGSQYVVNDQFSLGLLAFTTPFNDTDQNSFLSAISVFAGVRWNGFKFGYSYDVNTNQLFNTGGIHEFSVTYDFNVDIRFLERYKCVPFF